MSKRLNPLRDTQDAKPAAYCDKCRGEVYQSETMYFYDGRWLCSDCFKAEIASVLDSDPRTLALELGVDMQKYV